MRDFYDQFSSSHCAFVGALPSMNVHHISALLVLHHTAPAECAITLDNRGDLSCVIPSATAHDFTNVRALLQTRPAVPRGFAALSKTQYLWGLVKVDKVSPGGTAIVLVATVMLAPFWVAITCTAPSERHCR